MPFIVAAWFCCLALSFLSARRSLRLFAVPFGSRSGGVEWFLFLRLFGFRFLPGGAGIFEHRS